MQVQHFGVMAHVYASYGSRERPSDVKPFVRGVKPIELLNSAGRGYIVQVSWDREPRQCDPLPLSARCRPLRDAGAFSLIPIYSSRAFALSVNLAGEEAFLSAPEWCERSTGCIKTLVRDNDIDYLRGN